MAKVFYSLPADLAEDIESYSTDVKRYLAGELPPSIFKAKRVPRGIYEQRRNGTFMVRVRVAGGTLSSDQVRTLADVSNRFGSGSPHVTTRQDVQIHSVSIDDTPDVMRELIKVGLTSKGGGRQYRQKRHGLPLCRYMPRRDFRCHPLCSFRDRIPHHPYRQLQPAPEV